MQLTRACHEKSRNAGSIWFFCGWSRSPERVSSSLVCYWQYGYIDCYCIYILQWSNQKRIFTGMYKVLSNSCIFARCEWDRSATNWQYFRFDYVLWTINFYNDKMLALLRFTYCLSNDFVVGKLEPAFKNIHNGDVLNSSSQNAVIVNVFASPKEYGTMILKINAQ